MNRLLKLAQEVIASIRLKRWLKTTPLETIIETHLRIGFTRTDSEDGKVITLSRGNATLTICLSERKNQ